MSAPDPGAALAAKATWLDDYERMVRDGSFWDLPAQEADRAMLDLIKAARLGVRAIEEAKAIAAAEQERGARALDAMQRFCRAHGIKAGDRRAS